MSREDGEKGAPKFTQDEFAVLQAFAKKKLAWLAIASDVRKLSIIVIGLLGGLVAFRESILKLLGVE